MLILRLRVTEIMLTKTDNEQRTLLMFKLGVRLQNFAKGSLIALTGSVQTRNWEDQEGHKRKSVFVNATSVNFCGKKEDTKKEASEANAEEDDPF